MIDTNIYLTIQWRRSKLKVCVFGGGGVRLDLLEKKTNNKNNNSVMVMSNDKNSEACVFSNLAIIS